MSGPIVRTGATPEFWKNWDQIFGKKSKSGAKGQSETVEKKTPARKSAQPTKKKAPVAKTAARKSPSKKVAAKSSKKK